MNRRDLLIVPLIKLLVRDKKYPCDSDKLIFEYKRLWNSATFVNGTVVYPLDQWRAIDEAFTNIVAECIVKK